MGCGSSRSRGLEAGKHLSCLGYGAHALLWASLQSRLRRVCETATRQQVPSGTPNGHSRQHKGGSELSGAATLSPIHSPRDAATALAPRPTAATRPHGLSSASARPSSRLPHPVLSWALLGLCHSAPGLHHPHPSATITGGCEATGTSLGQLLLLSSSQQALEMGATVTLLHGQKRSTKEAVSREGSHGEAGVPETHPGY